MKKQFDLTQLTKLADECREHRAWNAKILTDAILEIRRLRELHTRDEVTIRKLSTENRQLQKLAKLN